MSDASTHHARMTLGEHLEELRRRLVLALLGLAPIVALAFYYGSPLLEFILAPARRVLHASGQGEMQSLSGLETFNAYMRVSIIAAVVVGSPWLLFQLWRFVAPGLHRHERRVIYLLLPLSTILTIAGVAFLFWMVLPLIFTFLINFGTSVIPPTISQAPLPDGIALPTLPSLAADPTAPTAGTMWFNEALHKVRLAVIAKSGAVEVLSVDVFRESGIRQQWRVSDVLSMMLTLIMAFAGAFQAPVVVLLLGWVGLVTPTFLAKYRKHALLVCVVIAAAVMPGDPASMLAMALPLYLLYELGGLLLRAFPPRSGFADAVTPTGGSEDEDDRP